MTAADEPFFMRKPWVFAPRHRPTAPDDGLGFATRALHAGFRPSDDLERFRAFVPPMVPSMTYPYADFDHIPYPVYGRTKTPTAGLREQRLAALEGGEAALTAGSGSQALFTLLFTLARPGDNVVTSLNIFGEGYKQAATIFPERCGVQFRFVADPDDPRSWDREIDGRTRLVWVVPGVFVSVLLGMFSKESAIVAVGLVPLAALLTSKTLTESKPHTFARTLLSAGAATAALVLYTELRRRWFPFETTGDGASPLGAHAPLATRLFHGFLHWFHQPRLPADPMNNPLVSASFPYRVAGALRVFSSGFWQLLVPLRLSGSLLVGAILERSLSVTNLRQWRTAEVPPAWV